MVSAGGQPVDGLKDITTRQRKDAHIARRTPGTDSSLGDTKELEEVFATLQNQA